MPIWSTSYTSSFIGSRVSNPGEAALGHAIVPDFAVPQLYDSNRIFRAEDRYSQITASPEQTRAGSVPAGVSLRWVATGGEPSEDAEAARRPTRE